MMTTTVATSRKKTYTTTFRSEYLSDVLKAVTTLVNDYKDYKCVEAIDTVVDMDAEDFRYYSMSVTYFNESDMVGAELARVAAEEAAEAIVAEEAANAAEVAEPTVKPVVVNGVTIENPEFYSKGMTSNVGKFVKGMWNTADEDEMWYWVRVNQARFPEYAAALKSILGEEAEQLRWQWEGMQEL